MHPARGAGAVACRRSVPRRRRRGASAAAHASVGQLVGPPGCRPGPLAGVQVRVLPGVLRRSWRDQPKAGDGSRLENGRPVRACEFDPRSLRQALSVQLEWTPACRAGDHGFESRTERATPWWLLAANPDFQSGPHGFESRPRCRATRPHEVAAACRILSPVARVQVPVGVQMLSWRNWQTPRIQGPVSFGRVGSTPTESTRTPTAGTGRRTALRTRCPSGREGSTPSVGTTGRGQVSRLALHAGPLGFDTPSLHQPSMHRPAWRNQVDARRSGRRVLRGIPVRVRGRVLNGL
jgi:hypothetical protein